MKKLWMILLAAMTAVSVYATTGDVNGDGEVSIADVNAIIDVILGNTTDEATVEAADVNADGEVSISDVNAVIDIILSGDTGGDTTETVTPKDIELDYTTLDEAAETIPEDEDAEDYGDYVENTNWSRTVYITLDGETATVTDNPSTVVAEVDGAHVTITSTCKKVKYVVTGSTTNGSLKFYSSYKFQLLLNGVDITNPNGAAINNQCSKSFYVVSADGTTNTLCDGTTYTKVGDEDQRGTMFSEGQILLSGSGLLNVYSVGKNCIASDDYVFVRPGCQIYLNSTSGHGIKGKDWVKINGGVINMELSADGAKGITTDSLVCINGGRTTIINTGAVVVDDSNDTTSCAGVKADYFFVMNDGELNVKCTGDGAKGMNVEQTITHNGGELNVVTTGGKGIAAPKGVKCDGNVVIAGGSFYSCAVNAKAMDADGTLTVKDGYTTFTNDKHLFEVIY